MTVIPIVICELGTISKRLVNGLEDLQIRGQVETIQTTALLTSARITRRVLNTWGDSSEKPSANAGVIDSQKSKMIIIKYENEIK